MWQGNIIRRGFMTKPIMPITPSVVVHHNFFSPLPPLTACECCWTVPLHSWRQLLLSYITWSHIWKPPLHVNSILKGGEKKSQTLAGGQHYARWKTRFLLANPIKQHNWFWGANYNCTGWLLWEQLKSLLLSLQCMGAVQFLNRTMRSATPPASKCDCWH